MSASAKKAAKPGPGRLSAEDAAELPNRLMDAAFDLFVERGFAGATMDDIAKRAGASTKTLYSRYANKLEILEAVVARNIERTVIAHIKDFALAPQDVAPRDYLFKLGVQICLASNDKTSGLQRVAFAEAHRMPALRQNYRSVTGRAVETIANALRIWREQGLLRFEQDTMVLGAIFFSAMTDTARIRAIMGDPMSRADIERHVATALDLLLASLIAEPPTRKRKS
jgi:TetR/AcrR family transcriptional repressor of mexJK operon